MLRAKEIAALTWAMLTDAEGNIGDAIHLVDQASKGSSGRVIPLNKELKAALVQIQKAQVGGRASPFVVTTERAEQTSGAAIVNLFAVWYRALGFNGCSSHSGRRGFITNAARKIGAPRLSPGPLSLARISRSPECALGSKESAPARSGHSGN